MADQTKYYPYVVKDSSQSSLKTVEINDYNSGLPGSIFSGSYPYSSSVSVAFYEGNDRKEIYALKNALNRNGIYSQHYKFSSSFGDKEQQTINLISIPSIFFGSSIQKGSVVLQFYVTGTLVGKLEDYNRRGELIETTGSNSGSVAGVVLYDYGFIILTGSWNLNNNFQEVYKYNPDGSKTSDYPKWIYWGAGLNRNDCQTTASTFDFEFDGTTNINTLTMFAHADKGEFNHSNNPTYVKYGEYSNSISTKNGYFEKDIMNIKNVTKYAFDNYTGSLEKQTYISKVGIFDENKNLIAVAKLSKPIRKTEGRDFTFKIKMDI